MAVKAPATGKFGGALSNGCQKIMPNVRHSTVRVGPANVFYREAGTQGQPARQLLFTVLESLPTVRHPSSGLRTCTALSTARRRPEAAPRMREQFTESHRDTWRRRFRPSLRAWDCAPVNRNRGMHGIDCGVRPPLR